jgi:hypothetical protein
MSQVCRTFRLFITHRNKNTKTSITEKARDFSFVLIYQQQYSD